MSDKEASFQYVKSLANNTNVFLIDVREPSELESSGTIPGAINIPLATLESVLNEIPSEEFKTKFNRHKPTLESELVFSCQGGRRSKAALDLATKLGYANAQHFPGGWLGWEKSLKNDN